MDKKFNIESELEMLLDDQLIKEAELLEKRLFADDGFEDYRETQEERKASYDRLIDRLKADGIYREEKNDCNKTYTHRKISRFIAKAAGIVIVSGMCVFAASMTSEANRNYLLHNMRILTGQDTRDVTDNDASNKKVDMDEYTAIAEIEKMMQIDVPEFYYRPENFEFVSYEIEVVASIARMQYRLDKEFVDLYIDKSEDGSATYSDGILGQETRKISMMYEDIEASISQVTDNKDDLSNCVAKWEKDNVKFSLYGRMNFEEFCEIVKKIAY